MKKLVQPQICILACNNLISRIIVTRAIRRNHELIAGIIILPNYSLNSQSGRRRMRKWIKTTSIRFIFVKFLEIYLDNVVAFLRGKSIGQVASNYGIPVKKIPSHKEEVLNNQLMKIKFSFLISVSHAILQESTIGLAKNMAVNVHGGDIPSYRGMANYVWMLANSEKSAFVTLHTLVKRIDAGFILDKREFVIDEQWSAFRLNVALAENGALLLNDFIAAIQREEIFELKDVSTSIDNFPYRSIPDKGTIKKLSILGKRLISFRDLLLFFRN